MSKSVIKEYIETIKKLQEISNNIIESYYNNKIEVTNSIISEIENMNMHIECCLDIINKNN